MARPKQRCRVGSGPSDEEMRRNLSAKKIGNASFYEGKRRHEEEVWRGELVARCGYRNSMLLSISGMKFSRILMSDECFALWRLSIISPSGRTRSPSTVSSSKS